MYTSYFVVTFRYVRRCMRSLRCVYIKGQLAQYQKATSIYSSLVFPLVSLLPSWTGSRSTRRRGSWV